MKSDLPPHAAGAFADLAFFERREAVRIVVSLEGRYTLSTKRDATGNLRQFACRVLNMSPDALFLAAPVLGPVGDRLIVYLDHFGKLDGRVLRCTERGLVSKLITTAAERAALAAKLRWYEGYKNHDLADLRLHRRVSPGDPISTLILPDGSRVTCFVIDMSASGAAVSADCQPPLGTVLAVGQVVGRVVRSFREGFAVRFVELQELDGLERRLIQR